MPNTLGFVAGPSPETPQAGADYRDVIPPSVLVVSAQVSVVRGFFADNDMVDGVKTRDLDRSAAPERTKIKKSPIPCAEEKGYCISRAQRSNPKQRDMDNEWNGME